MEILIEMPVNIPKDQVHHHAIAAVLNGMGEFMAYQGNFAFDDYEKKMTVAAIQESMMSIKKESRKNDHAIRIMVKMDDGILIKYFTWFHDYRKKLMASRFFAWELLTQFDKFVTAPVDDKNET